MEPNIWHVKDFGISSKHPDENLMLISLTGIKTNFRVWNKPVNANMEIGHESMNFPFVYGGGIGYHLIFNELDNTPFIGWFASSLDLVYRSYGPLEYFVVRRLEELYPTSSDPATASTKPRRLTVSSNEISLTKRVRRFKRLGTIDLTLAGQVGGDDSSEITGFAEVRDGAYIAIQDRQQFSVQLHLVRGIKYLTRKRFYLKNVGFDFANVTESSPESFVTSGVYRPGAYSSNKYFFVHATLANYRPHPKYKQFVDNFTLKFRLGMQSGFHSMMIDSMIRFSAKIDWETKVILYNNLAYGTAVFTGPIFKLNF
jgi:hypothetical protein